MRMHQRWYFILCSMSSTPEIPLAFSGVIPRFLQMLWTRCLLRPTILPVAVAPNIEARTTTLISFFIASFSLGRRFIYYRLQKCFDFVSNTALGYPVIFKSKDTDRGVNRSLVHYATDRADKLYLEGVFHLDSHVKPCFGDTSRAGQHSQTTPA